jgi:hypothetical protein
LSDAQPDAIHVDKQQARILGNLSVMALHSRGEIRSLLRAPNLERLSRSTLR